MVYSKNNELNSALDNNLVRQYRPRILFSAINGGSGKTFITSGVIAALSARGLKVQTFKKGPDYIDSKWHALASGRKCYNLDLYLFKDHVISSLFEKSADADLSIIEGNHGLYDSIDSEGLGSTAFLARHTQTPVILIVNCHKMSRSVAAMINGFVNFEKDTKIAGVILNQVSGKRHEDKILEAIEINCSVEVLGVVYKTNSVNLEQRHMGIITTEDKPEVKDVMKKLQNIAEESIQIDKLIEIANQTQPLIYHRQNKIMESVNVIVRKEKSITIAVARDAAFNFYYPDNLEALENEGANLIYFSPISDATIPKADGIYIGGGYPEIYALELSRNLNMKKSIFNLCENNLPIFAECGGMMYMSEKIIWNDIEHEMVGTIKGNSVMHKKPQGKGYVELIRENNAIDKPTLWEIPDGTISRAHEFHYSVLENLAENTDLIFTMKRGAGIINHHDGIIYKNLLATYTHFHSLASPWWAPAFVNACQKNKDNR